MSEMMYRPDTITSDIQRLETADADTPQDCRHRNILSRRFYYDYWHYTSPFSFLCLCIPQRPPFQRRCLQVSLKATISSRLLTQVLDHYAPAFYWSTIETNAGILSACLPTLRPLFEAYPFKSILSNFTKQISSRFRSTLRSSTDFRLNSMEHGRTEAEDEAFRVRQTKPYAVYDGSIAAPQNPADVVDAKTSQRTRYHD